MAQASEHNFGIDAAQSDVTLADSRIGLTNRLIAKRGDCCGCGACASACPVEAIVMKNDVEGFLYPWIDEELCVDCGRCNRACGFKQRLSEGNREDSLEDEDSQTYYAAKHCEETIRMKSSSGGMYWAFAEPVLAQGGVVYGCAFDESLRACHIRCETLEEAERCCGSKYSQSVMGDCFKDVRNDLKSGRRVLFTGTPCQVDALNAFLSLVSVGTDGLITADIICHGVPSPMLFQEHLAFIGSKRSSKVVGYWHRPKDSGWRHQEKFQLENGSHESGTMLSGLWKRLFYSNLCLRGSCYVCPYAKKKRHSDITIGDFWGIQNKLPHLMDTTGVSAISVNTTKGAEFISSLDSLVLEECSFEDILPRNPLLSHPTKVTRSRALFWDDFNENGYAHAVTKLGWYGPKRIVKDVVWKIIGKRK